MRTNNLKGFRTTYMTITSVQKRLCALNVMKFALIFCSLFLFVNYSFGTACTGCPNDNGGGASGSGGPAYDCDTMGTVIFVDISRPNNNGNGKSWATAKKYLQSALAIANNCTNITIIKVAEGTYSPNISGTNQDLTFFIGNNITLEGGYSSGGSSTPNHASNPTILTGYLATNINCYHIMVIYAQTGAVTISGFRFKDGFADGTGTLEIDNGVFIGRNDGAAVYSLNNNNVTFKNCAIYNNVANDKGGAIASNNSDIKYVNTVFTDNTAGVDGGGIYMWNTSTCTFTNCALVQNLYYSGGGGAIYNTVGTTATLYNTILWENTNTWNGGGIRNIFYSVLQDNNSTNGGSISNSYYLDPGFINTNDLNGPDNVWFTSDDGLNVCDGSICVNRGSNSAPNIPTKDIKTEYRIFNSQIDIGPYEKQNYPVLNLIYPYNDSCLVRVYSGKTILPSNDCDMISIFEPSSNINIEVKGVSKDVVGGVFTYNNVYYAGQIYYFEKIPWGNYNGKITLPFKNIDFTFFNSLSYSINDLPTAANPSNKTHLRILKFPEPFSTYQPNLATEQPIIIDPIDTDIVYDSVNDIWNVTFDNTEELGMFLVTTFYEYVFNGNGDFSEETNWIDNNKPYDILPSFNKIKIEQGAYCKLNVPLTLKPYSSLTAE